VQIALPQTAVTIDPRNDKPPFSDLRVRKAMQLAIDLKGLAKDYYKGTVEPYPSTLTGRELTGWGFPYEQWPQELKNEYVYNPKEAKKLLADAGYPDGFKTNIVANTSADMDREIIFCGHRDRHGNSAHGINGLDRLCNHPPQARPVGLCRR
jgi:ABC-type transport system substrate-binding protein